MLQIIGAQKQTAIISNFNISELFHILLHREKLTLDRVHDYLEKLVRLPGVELEEVSKEMLLEAIKISKKYQVDLADACAVIIMRKQEIKYIYSKDGHFDKFKDIERTMEPFLK